MGVGEPELKEDAGGPAVGGVGRDGDEDLVLSGGEESGEVEKRKHAGDAESWNDLLVGSGDVVAVGDEVDWIFGDEAVRVYSRGSTRVRGVALARVQRLCDLLGNSAMFATRT